MYTKYLEDVIVRIQRKVWKQRNELDGGEWSWVEVGERFANTQFQYTYKETCSTVK